MDAASLTLLQPASPGTGQPVRSKEDVTRVAEQFEATFLSTMLATMFQGVKSEAPFNGGAGEDAFGSFLTDAMARQLARAGGVGLTDTLSRELLKLQGLAA